MGKKKKISLIGGKKLIKRTRKDSFGDKKRNGSGGTA